MGVNVRAEGNVSMFSTEEPVFFSPDEDPSEIQTELEGTNLLACLPDGLRMFDACFVSPKLWYFAKQLDHLAWCQVDPGAEFSTQVT